jgi:GNAT superfamily N-acetyltransferase
VPEVAEVALRHYVGTEDIDPWLKLRSAAFARQRLGIRQWTVEDFRAELLDKAWWTNQRMWLAEMAGADGPVLVGSVTWADRATPDVVRPAVHWLAVHPALRGRGVGRMLMSALEAGCWDAGYRQVWLETHTAWTAAAAFYRRLDYAPE